MEKWQMKYDILFSLLVVIVLSLSMMNCSGTSRDVTITDLPINLSQPDSEEVDLDLAISNAQAAVRRWLPNAQYRGMVYKGNCQDLPKIRGVIVVGFMQIKDKSFRIQPEVLTATASIQTDKQTVNIDIWDDTYHYPNTDLDPIVTDAHFRQVSKAAYEYLLKEGIENCNVTVSQLGNVWSVLCNAVNETDRLCNFDVDSKTLEIITSQ
jgi:hypothetical protein